MATPSHDNQDNKNNIVNIDSSHADNQDNMSVHYESAPQSPVVDAHVLPLHPDSEPQLTARLVDALRHVNNNSDSDNDDNNDHINNTNDHFKNAVGSKRKAAPVPAYLSPRPIKSPKPFMRPTIATTDSVISTRGNSGNNEVDNDGFDSPRELTLSLHDDDDDDDDCTPTATDTTHDNDNDDDNDDDDEDDGCQKSTGEEEDEELSCAFESATLRSSLVEQEAALNAVVTSIVDRCNTQVMHELLLLSSHSDTMPTSTASVDDNMETIEKEALEYNFAWSVATQKGYRYLSQMARDHKIDIHAHMEDMHYPSFSGSPNHYHQLSGRNYQLFILADGHGGHDCAEYVVKHLPHRIDAIMQSRLWDLDSHQHQHDLKDALQNVVLQIDEEYCLRKLDIFKQWIRQCEQLSALQARPKRPADDGCTLVVNILYDGFFINCNTGDSRTLLLQRPRNNNASSSKNNSDDDWEPLFMSDDHTPAHYARARLIHANGGRFLVNGNRVNVDAILGTASAAEPVDTSAHPTRFTAACYDVEGKHRPMTPNRKPSFLDTTHSVATPTTTTTTSSTSFFVPSSSNEFDLTNVLLRCRVARPEGWRLPVLNHPACTTLNLTGTLGDMFFKYDPPLLSARPDVRIVKMAVDRMEYVMVMASDGVWDHMADTRAEEQEGMMVEFVRRVLPCTEDHHDYEDDDDDKNGNGHGEMGKENHMNDTTHEKQQQNQKVNEETKIERKLHRLGVLAHGLCDREEAVCQSALFARGYLRYDDVTAFVVLVEGRSDTEKEEERK